MRWYFIASLILSLFSLEVYADSLTCPKQECVGVVDVGSTGSRLHIYAFDRDPTHTPIQVTELWSKKIKPGFASLEATPSSVGNYLSNLFQDAPSYSAGLYFYATGGMRLVSKPNQQKLYNLVKNWFSTQSQWQLKDAKTISGHHEGLYGFLAVNYQLDKFNSKENALVSVMDMGGASVQISFPIEEDIEGEDIEHLNLYGRKFSLLTHSFLGLGQTEVSHQFLDEPSCFSNNYELPNGLKAAGDVYACESKIALFMNSTHHVNEKIAPFLSQSTTNQWYVMGGLAELSQSQSFNLGSEFTANTLKEKANAEICQQDWSSIFNNYPNDDYIYGYCLFPAYYSSLMSEGYGISSQEIIHLMPSSKTADWTLGVVLTLKNAI